MKCNDLNWMYPPTEVVEITEDDVGKEYANPFGLEFFVMLDKLGNEWSISLPPLCVYVGVEKELA